MAGVARPDVDSISNQSGDTFLLTDVDDDVPSLEEQQASIPVSENLESNLQNLESNLSACQSSNTTYAAAAASAEAPRVNEDDTLVSRNYRNELFLSSFERENFHPDNVTPERPCTAYFQSDVFEDSSAVFSALRSQGFASSAIRCLQRRPTGEMLITFSTVHVKNAFLEKNSIQIRHRRYAINDSDRFLTFLNIYDAPHELSDNAIIKRLEPYCEVVNYRRGRYLSNKMVFNGNRHFRVRIYKAIPSYLRFGKFLIRLSHDGQTHTCRRCNRRGHFAKDCPNTVCFNCDELGHKVDECTHEELCCICKEPSHRARHCPYSWYRSSPVPSPHRGDPSTSVSRDIDLPPLQRVPPANDPPPAQDVPAEPTPQESQDPNDDLLDANGLLILRSLFGSDDDLSADSADDNADDNADNDDDMSGDDDDDDNEDTDDDMGDEVDNDDDNVDDDDDDDVNADDDATADDTNDEQPADSQPLFSSLDLSATPPESSDFGPIRNSHRIFSRRQPAPMPEPLMALHRRATAPAPVPSGRTATRSTTSDESPTPPPSHDPGIVSESVT